MLHLCFRELCNMCTYDFTFETRAIGTTSLQLAFGMCSVKLNLSQCLTLGKIAERHPKMQPTISSEIHCKRNHTTSTVEQQTTAHWLIDRRGQIVVQPRKENTSEKNINGESAWCLLKNAGSCAPARARSSELRGGRYSFCARLRKWKIKWKWCEQYRESGKWASEKMERNRGLYCVRFRKDYEEE